VLEFDEHFVGQECLEEATLNVLPGRKHPGICTSPGITWQRARRSQQRSSGSLPPQMSWWIGATTGLAYHQAERYCIAHVLATLPFDRLSFPLTLTHSNKPDFLLG